MPPDTPSNIRVMPVDPHLAAGVGPATAAVTDPVSLPVIRPKPL